MCDIARELQRTPVKPEALGVCLASVAAAVIGSGAAVRAIGGELALRRK
jgi:hypothetical protein